MRSPISIDVDPGRASFTNMQYTHSSVRAVLSHDCMVCGIGMHNWRCDLMLMLDECFRVHAMSITVSSRAP